MLQSVDSTYFRCLAYSSPTPIHTSLLLIGWSLNFVYSIEVKMVTRAEGHGGAPHPIELTSSG